VFAPSTTGPNPSLVILLVTVAVRGFKVALNFEVPAVMRLMGPRLLCTRLPDSDGLLSTVCI